MTIIPIIAAISFKLLLVIYFGNLQLLFDFRYEAKISERTVTFSRVH